MPKHEYLQIWGRNTHVIGGGHNEFEAECTVRILESLYQLQNKDH
jgi:hypothetical protein